MNTLLVDPPCWWTNQSREAICLNNIIPCGVLTSTDRWQAWGENTWRGSGYRGSTCKTKQRLSVFGLLSSCFIYRGFLLSYGDPDPATLVSFYQILMGRHPRINTYIRPVWHKNFHILANIFLPRIRLRILPATCKKLKLWFLVFNNFSMAFYIWRHM